MSREIEKYGSKSERGKKIYKKFLDVVEKTWGYLFSNLVAHNPEASPKLSASRQKGWEILNLVNCVMEQTKRRVLQGEKVASSEKIVSLFEPHTDIIVKGKRKVQFGHKLNVTTGASGLIVDMMVERGNWSDSATVRPVLERQVEIYGRPPRQAAFDGGYGSKRNLEAAKDLGVRDVMFHKKRGLKVEAMTRSHWVFKKLWDFRAGVEGNISTLKRKYGWYHCNWKGWDKFQAYAWLGVVACNLITMARIELWL